MFKPTRSDALRLVEAAIQAPSADNQHHVRFAIRADGIALQTDDFFDQCTVPHRRVLTLLSYGATVENLRLALTDCGWSFVPRWFPSTNDPTLLLDVAWASLAPAKPDPLAREIASRHTNRHFFRGPVLTRVEREAIESALGSKAKIEWFDTPRRRSALLRLMRLAETERFRDRRHHAELFESIAFDVGWTGNSPERLAPGALAIEPALRHAFKALRHWPVMRAARFVGLHRLLGLRAGDLPARLSPHLLAITSALPGDLAALEGGIAFQRVWLAAQAAGLALQPMVASAILIHGSAQSRSASLGGRLAEGWRRLIGDDQPVVVFRLGRAAAPTVRSTRRSAEDYLVVDR